MTPLDRRQYELTDGQFGELIEGIKVARNAPLIMLQCGMPESPQEAANRLWCALGREIGFDGMTVEPLVGKGVRFFTAVPTESTNGQ